MCRCLAPEVTSALIMFPLYFSNIIVFFFVSEYTRMLAKLVKLFCLIFKRFIFHFYLLEKLNILIGLYIFIPGFILEIMKFSETLFLSSGIIFKGGQTSHKCLLHNSSLYVGRHFISLFRVLIGFFKFYSC